MKKTLGGQRLGSGNRMQVDMHGFERSTHDMGYIWRSTMAAGTLVPFLKELALPGDTFDIRLNCDIKTHPTIGPLFGSYKVQLDVFLVPMRLYHSALHNNRLGIGLNMSQIKLPKLTLYGSPDDETDVDIDNAQINPSAIFSYLGIRGVGIALESARGTGLPRNFNAIPFLAYWDIYKNYYANKQEEVGYVISSPAVGFNRTATQIQDDSNQALSTDPQAPSNQQWTTGEAIRVFYSGTLPSLKNVYIKEVGQSNSKARSCWEIAGGTEGTADATKITFNVTVPTFRAEYWGMAEEKRPPILVGFPLAGIDTMREKILQSAYNAEFNVNSQNLTPYSYALQVYDDAGTMRMVSKRNQEGLAIKTYQSDLFNNWLSTEWIDGAGGINEITAVDTSGGSFNIDALNLSKKVYDMLNRIAVSGGSYNDWLEAVYDHEAFNRAESPVYMGGLIKELTFQEVVSNSESAAGQPLGTLAGKGVMSGKHKGGEVTIKVDEPSYIIGIVSLTPRVDYSQGNKWDVTLETLDDLHKPSLDQIGFQELITEQMAWWSTNNPTGNAWIQKSAGKQPAWINYMTNVNEVRGNFANKYNEMFMTLNRRYEAATAGQDNIDIADLTTYVDPSIYNYIFAETSLDAQNFWTQISVDMTARRKMSAKIMPNL